MNAASIVACPNPPCRSPDFTSSMSSPGSIGVGTARGTWRYPVITAIFTTTKNAAKTPQINKRNRLPLSALRCR